jgi:nucleoside phosphorylase
MRVLVTFAVEAEFAPWRKRHPFISHAIEVPHRDFDGVYYTTEIDGCHVEVYLTGIGWTLPEYGLRKLVAAKPDVCISSGLAGGLKPGFGKGDVIAARTVGSLNDGGKVGSTLELVQIAEECGAKPADICITSRHILGQAQFKRAMGLFGDIVEMESFKIMTMATGPQIRTITVRAISDTVDEDMPLDFSRVLDRSGKVRVGQLALQLARYPHKIPALIRFGRDSQQAAVRLADFLDRYLVAVEKNFAGGIPMKRECLDVAAR